MRRWQWNPEDSLSLSLSLSFRFCAAILLLSGWCSVAAKEDVLFDASLTPADGVLSGWHQAYGDALIEAKPLSVDISALQPDPDAGSTKGADFPSHALVGQRVGVKLPQQDAPMTLEVTKVEETVEGVVTYSGYVSGEVGVFTFSVDSGRLLGNILIDEVALIIRPAGGATNAHELIMVDRGLLPQSDDTLGKTALSGHSASAGHQSRSSGGTGSGDVRTLFLFANNVGNQVALTSNIVSEFNSALARNGIASNFKISAADIRTVSSGFTGSNDCRGKILYDMHARNAPFASIDQWMSNSAADIAFLIVKNVQGEVKCPASNPIQSSGRIGGISTGFFPDDVLVGLDPSSSPFSLSSDTYALGDLTALHEIGHTLGGRHANFSNGWEFVFMNGQYAHGFDNDNAGDWQTIMGGYRKSTADRCTFDSGNPDPATQSCVRIPYFSNPDKSATVNGQFVPTIGTTVVSGTGDNVQYKADMETWLQSTGMPVVSGYTADPLPPANPPSLSVTPGFCFGSSSVGWTVVSGASNYRLSRSFSSGFSSPSVIYDGSGTFTAIDIPGPPEPGTWYLRVKACNAGGCSGWSNQQSANWVNGCF